MNIPGDLLYTKDHEWIKKENDNEATIGITDYAQGELGDIVYVEVETEGDSFEKGETFGTVEAVKTVSDLILPVSGEVVEYNSKLEDAPETINSDPYGEGWIIKVKISNEKEFEELMSADDYKKMIES
jgi:glycine cleavage system H protein